VAGPPLEGSETDAFGSSLYRDEDSTAMDKVVGVADRR
jgi:hypothetical protein